MTPAVKAGMPVEVDDYEKKEVEGIPFYIRKDLVNKQFEINWAGFWIFGQFVVKELE